MKLPTAGAIVGLTALMTAAGYYAAMADDALLLAALFGLVTFNLSCITAFVLGFISARRSPLRAIFATVAVLLVVGTVSALAFVTGAPEDAVPRAFVLGFLTLLIVGGGSYLAYYSRSMSAIDAPSHERDEQEVLWARTARSMVHYKSGSPLKFWDAVGGRLFLSTTMLEFRTFPAELSVYRIVIPLAEIRRAHPCSILGIPGLLRIERHDGSFELFGFGAAFDGSHAWADAIMAFRDDLDDREVASP